MRNNRDLIFLFCLLLAQRQNFSGWFLKMAAWFLPYIPRLTPMLIKISKVLPRFNPILGVKRGNFGQVYKHQSNMFLNTCSIFTFSHFYWLNVLWSSGCGKSGGCLCVCLYAPVWRNYLADFNQTFTKWFLFGLGVCVSVLAHKHIWWRHNGHVLHVPL